VQQSRRRSWLLAGALGLLLAAGAWWIRSAAKSSSDRAGVERSPSEAVRATVEVGKLAPSANPAKPTPEESSESPAEPRVAPIVARPPARGGATKAGAPSPRSSAEVFSLQPLPRGKSGSTNSGAVLERPARAAGTGEPAPNRAVSRMQELREQSRSPLRSDEASGSDDAPPEDPWNPKSFGERR
jgi:hypothetical protein